jgi:hypothetical protein
MISLIKFLAWTACAMALGVWLATARVGGATPLERLTQLWKKVPAPVAGLEEKIEDAKDALSSAKDHQVRERHSDKDKDAVNKLIAKRTSPK